MKKKTFFTLIMSAAISLLMCGCDGSSTTTTEETNGERDYYDLNDPRNTDNHYDDDEYREALDKAHKVWDAQT